MLKKIIWDLSLPELLTEVEKEAVRRLQEQSRAIGYDCLDIDPARARGFTESEYTYAECLFISGRPEYLEQASALGMACIGYYDPTHPSAHLAKADIVVESFVYLDVSFLENVWKRSQGLPVTIYEGEHIILRELTVEDIDSLHRICQEPLVRAYISDMKDDPALEKIKHRFYIRHIYTFYGYGLWGIFFRDPGHPGQDLLIGRCGLEQHSLLGEDQMMLSYYLDTAYWGRGLAREACLAVFAFAREELDIHQIVAVIVKDNERSLNLARSLGMHRTGDLMYENRDSYLYVIDL